MKARPRIVKETPVSALVDGDGGLGHVPAHFAMQVAIDKAKAIRHGDRRGAQLGAFRRHRLLHADGREGRADRHGVHQRLQRSRSRRPSARKPSSAPTHGRSPPRAPTGGRSCSTWRRRRSPPAASATRPMKACRLPARLGAEQGRAAQHRSVGGARERRFPDLARRLAGEFELQGLRAGGDGQHPRRRACRARP